MAGDFDAVKRWVDKVETVTDGSAQRRILAKAGDAGKKAALEAAAASLGGDRKFSNLKRGALTAGYDSVGSTSVEIKFRGPWKLAESGRRASGPIFPKRGRGKGKGPAGGRAVMTPGGPRASSRFGPSRGLDTYSDATKKASRAVPKAAHDQMLDEIRKVVS